MKAKKFFILVTENLHSKLYSTEKLAKYYIEKDPFQKCFIFYDKIEAQNFLTSLNSKKTKENLEKLEFEFKINEKLKPYETKIMKSKAFNQNINEEGVSINLKVPTYIFVAIDNKSEPLLYFNQLIIKKHTNQFHEIRKFLEPKDALSYIKEQLEYLEKNKSTIVNEQEKIDENKIKKEFSNLTTQLISYDSQYKSLFQKINLSQFKPIQLNNQLPYIFQCATFNTIHYHSALGITIQQANSNEIIKTFGQYIGQNKVYALGLYSVLFAIRYAIFLQINSLIIHTEEEQDYQFLNKMIYPKYPLQNQLVEAIDSYSTILSTIRYELVEKNECEKAKKAAIQAFQRYAYVKDRAKKYKSNFIDKD